MIVNARDFIRHPFATCPKCGAEKEAMSRGVRFVPSNETSHDLSNHENPAAISLSINGVTHGEINAWKDYLQIALNFIV